MKVEDLSLTLENAMSATDPLPSLDDALALLTTAPHWTEGSPLRVRALQAVVLHQAALLAILQHDLITLRTAHEAHLRGHFDGLLP